jgi:hypothetical protein
LFEKLPPGCSLPSITQVCEWAGITEKTRERWVKVGLVRQIPSGADEQALLELILVRHMERWIGADATSLAWPAIQAEVLDQETVPDRLDLVWLLDPPQARVVTTDAGLAAAARERPKTLQVLPLAPVLGEAQESWRLYVAKEWNALSARREAQKLGNRKRGPKSKIARMVKPSG